MVRDPTARHVPFPLHPVQPTYLACDAVRIAPWSARSGGATGGSRNLAPPGL